MRIYLNSNDYKLGDKHSAIGLGTFDGLHTGHMKLIATLTDEAEASDLTSILYTFTGDPDDVLKKDFHTRILTDFEKKTELLSETKLDCLCVDEFTSDYAKTGAEEFVSEILVKRLGMKLAVCGFNYTFGRYRKGNVDTLRSLQDKYGYRLIVIPPVVIDGEIVSSTLIRKSVIHGDVEKAAVFLGRPYTISGTVISGERIGRRIGFPTANIVPHEHAAVPPFGVYITRTRVKGVWYESVTNIGVRPTFEPSASEPARKPIIETFLLKSDMQFYDCEIDVSFLKKIRNEIKFTDIGKLAAKIKTDVTEAERYFADLTLTGRMLK